MSLDNYPFHSWNMGHTFFFHHLMFASFLLLSLLPLLIASWSHCIVVLCLFTRPKKVVSYVFSCLNDFHCYVAWTISFSYDKLIWFKSLDSFKVEIFVSNFFNKFTRTLLLRSSLPRILIYFITFKGLLVNFFTNFVFLSSKI